MAHNLDMSGDKVALFLRTDPAWHNLAGYIAGETEHISMTRLLELAYLANWNVRVEPYPEDLTVDANGTKPLRTVRDNPFDPSALPQVLGPYVEKRYTVFTPEMLAETTEYIVRGDIMPESAGAIDGGRKIFISLRMPEMEALDPNGRNDKIARYLLATTSFDGSQSTMFLPTNVRVVCQNTFNMAIDGSSNIFKVRHTRTAEERAKTAGEALGFSYDYLDLFNKAAGELIQREISNDEAWRVINAIHPKVDDTVPSRGLTLYNDKVDDIWNLYNGLTCENIHGTAWGIVNALTEYEDYYKGARGENKSTNVAVRASGFDAASTNQRGRIMSAAKSLLLV